MPLAEVVCAINVVHHSVNRRLNDSDRRIESVRRVLQFKMVQVTEAAFEFCILPQKNSSLQSICASALNLLKPSICSGKNPPALGYTSAFCECVSRK